jgi:hypothetical protein
MENKTVVDSLLDELVQISVSHRTFVEKVKSTQMGKIDLLKSFDSQSPEESNVIQKILDILEPIKTTNTHLRSVQAEIASLSRDGKEIDSPEKEMEWQAKIDEAKKLDEDEARKIRSERSIDLPGVVNLDNKGPLKESELNPAMPVSKLVGIGEKSSSKLVQAGVLTVGAFNALSFEQKVQIVGPVVAEKFK